jgi:hypothetical protein
MALFIMPALLQAQPGPPRSRDELVGWVLDAAGKPMGDAEVLIAGTSYTTRSNAKGFWRFADPPTGPHVVLAVRLHLHRTEMVHEHKGADGLALGSGQQALDAQAAAQVLGLRLKNELDGHARSWVG